MSEEKPRQSGESSPSATRAPAQLPPAHTLPSIAPTPEAGWPQRPARPRQEVDPTLGA